MDHPSRYRSVDDHIWIRRWWLTDDLMMIRRWLDSNRMTKSCDLVTNMDHLIRCWSVDDHIRIRWWWLTDDLMMIRRWSYLWWSDRHFFSSWPYPRRVFQCTGLEITFWYGVPYEMVLRNIYSLVFLALVASSCSSYWLSTILSGRVLQRGWPGSDSSRWSSPCSCELNSASRVSSQFIFTPRNHM